MRAGGGITTRGDAVRRPFMMVSFLFLIPNTLFLFFCARRLLHRGAILRGIASDSLRAGGGITIRGDAVRRPFMLVSFLFLIPNTLLLFFCARRLLHRGAILRGIASDPLRAGGAPSRDHSPGDRSWCLSGMFFFLLFSAFDIRFSDILFHSTSSKFIVSM